MAIYQKWKSRIDSIGPTMFEKPQANPSGGAHDMSRVFCPCRCVSGSDAETPTHGRR
jgi:hypothetical protein